MRLTVKEKERDARLGLPTGLLLNRVTAIMLTRKANKHGISITYRQTMKLVKALYNYRRTHEEWVLVEVSGANGEYVKIKMQTACRKARCLHCLL